MKKINRKTKMKILHSLIISITDINLTNLLFHDDLIKIFSILFTRFFFTWVQKYYLIRTFFFFFCFHFDERKLYVASFFFKFIHSLLIITVLYTFYFFPCSSFLWRATVETKVYVMIKKNIEQHFYSQIKSEFLKNLYISRNYLFLFCPYTIKQSNLNCLKAI